MRFLEQLNIFLNKLLMVFGGLALLGLMVLATANVVLRIFGRPFSGTYELVGFLGALLIAFALGFTQKRKDHIVVDIVSRKFPAWLARPMDALKFLAETVFFAIVAWYVFQLGLRVREDGEVSETLKIAYHPFIYAVAAGFGLLALNLFVDFLITVFNPPAARPALPTKTTQPAAAMAKEPVA